MIAVQGAGGGGILALSQIIVADMVPLRGKDRHYRFKRTTLTQRG